MAPHVAKLNWVLMFNSAVQKPMYVAVPDYFPVNTPGSISSRHK